MVVAEVVRVRHRAEAAEWRALFRVFGEEEARLARQHTGGLQPDVECLRVDAAEAACARWCVAAPVTVASTRYRLRAAIQLFEHLPLVAEAFTDGDLSGQLVTQIVDRTYEVDPDLLPAVDAALRGELVESIAAGVRYSANAIDSAVDEIILFLDPDGVRTARRTAQGKVGVRMEPRAGGVARMTAVLPGPAGAAVYAAVDLLARRLHGRAPDDDEGRRLTLNHCRAVALLALTAGGGLLEATGLPAEAVHTIAEETDAADAGDGRGEVLLTVHATAEAVERPSDDLPVWISRLGLLPSSAVAGILATARRTTPRAGPVDQLRPTDPLSWLTSPLTPPDAYSPPGPAARLEAMNRAARRALARSVRDEVPAYALRYRIPEWLKVRIRQRDGCCRFPGCGVPAADCDVDHLEPFLHRDPINGGWTIELNLGCLCRRHHRLKTHDRWTITTDLDGVFTFTSPDGHIAHTHPAGPAARIDLADRIHGPPSPCPDADTDTVPVSDPDPDASPETWPETGPDTGTDPDRGLEPDPRHEPRDDDHLIRAAWGASGPWPETGGIDPSPSVELYERWAQEDIDRARAGGWDHPGSGAPDATAA